MALLAAILVSIGDVGYPSSDKTKPKREFDESNPYMKFGSNWVINDLGYECPQKQTDRQRIFSRPSCLLFIGQNPYLNLEQGSMEAIQILYLEEIR